MIHRTMEHFLVLDSWVNVTWICDYRLCLGTKKLLSNTHPSQGHMEEYIGQTKRQFGTHLKEH